MTHPYEQHVALPMHLWTLRGDHGISELDCAHLMSELQVTEVAVACWDPSLVMPALFALLQQGLHTGIGLTRSCLEHAMAPKTAFWPSMSSHTVTIGELSETLATRALTLAPSLQI